MAIARMLKVDVIGHSAHADDVVQCMQDAGAVDIERIEMERGGITRPSAHAERRNVLDEDVARAQFVRDFLGRFHTSDVAFKSFISEKVHIGLAEFDGLAADEFFDELYGECESIASRLAEIAREREHLKVLIHELEPWAGLHLQISQWKGTEHVMLFTGTVPVLHSEAIRESMRQVSADLSIQEAGRSRDLEAWVVMAHRASVDDIRAALALTEFTEVAFPDLKDYPAEEIEDARTRIQELGREEERLRERAAELEREFHYAVALVQALLTRRDALEVRDNFAATERTFLATGWVPVSAREQVEEAVRCAGEEVDITFRAPQEGERVPVALENPWFIRPFEVLTDLYGRPAYGDVDPTPLLAGFFFLFFGMCIGDAGYGVVLMLAAYLMKTRLDVAPGVKRFMDLLIAGGLASAIVGVATRSYFSLTAEALPGFMRYEPLLDPLDDIIVLLLASVAIGVVHVVFGTLVNVYRRAKAGDWWSAVQEDLSGLLLLGGLAATFMTGQITPFAWTAVVAVLLAGRVTEMLVVERNPLKALLGIPKGLLGLYGLTGYLSDFLSYTRLAALGLASLLVGQVMNILAEMVVGAPWGIGIVAAALILVVGHAFNLVINLLGAFVHPARLQFVEFFGRFYEAGGRPYKPFARRTTSLVLHPVAGEQEGGTHS